ncbi:MAG: single-stranded-DNA-specific exonuclease RecJ, partial [Oceanidesulfovibrio sp.]
MRWKYRTPPGKPTDETYTPAPQDILGCAESLQVSPIVTELLWRRGIEALPEMDAYLSPGLRHLVRPADWPALEQASTLVARAIREGRTIAVWGDYDVDGVTASAILIDYLTRRGVAVLHHLPARQEEGYGLNAAGVEELAAQGAALLVTVDCGISDTEAVTRARELGLDVVVTDHHLPPPELPPANAILNPQLAPIPCPTLANLAGAGVAFFLIAAINSILGPNANGDSADVRSLLDLVALGTLADVVDLKGQNRILAKNGLLLVAEAPRPGLAALKEAAGFARKAALGAGQVVFGLTPRINAAGRMGLAEDALQMLLAPDFESAWPFAQKLETLNKERRAEEERILQEALAQAENQAHRLGLVLYGEDWHPGVVGIVASRIVERLAKPALILCAENGQLKGSGRSAHHFDLYAGLTACKDLLTRYGGHRQAAGLALMAENIEKLRDSFHAIVSEQLGPEPLAHSLTVDRPLAFSDIDFTLLKELDMLQPYGMGNPEPVFVSNPVEVRGLRRFGKNRLHASLDLLDKTARAQLRGKYWRKANDLPDAIKGSMVRVAFTPKIDSFDGVP